MSYQSRRSCFSDNKVRYRIRKNLNNKVFFFLMAELGFFAEYRIHILKKFANQVAANQLLNFFRVCKAKMFGKGHERLTFLSKFIHRGSNSFFFLRRFRWYINKNCFWGVCNMFCNLKTVANKTALAISFWLMLNLGQNTR